MTKDSIFNNCSHRKLIFGLVIYSYFLLMFGNGIVSMTHPDEVFYIQSAKEMVAHNNWMTPMIFDEVQFEKPFLAFALFAAGVKWFGLNPFVCRFPSAIFGIIGVCVTYWIAWMLFRRKRLSFLSGIILGSSFIYLAFARTSLIDMISSIIMTVSIGFFYWAYQNPHNKTKGLLWFSIFSALAVLTTGILGVTCPVAVILIFLVYKRDIKFLKCQASLWSAFLFLGLSLPWHILMYAEHGQWFLEEYFGNVHTRRILGSEHARLNNWYFYIVLMFVGIMPWFLFLFPAGCSIRKCFKQKNDLRFPFAFLLSWIIGVYILAQPVHLKLAGYILPVFPAIAIILAQYLDQTLRQIADGKDSSTLNFCVHLMCQFILIFVTIEIILAVKGHIDVLENLTPVYFFAVCLVIIVFLLSIFCDRMQYLRMLLMYPAISIVLLATLFLARPDIESWVSRIAQGRYHIEELEGAGEQYILRIKKVSNNTE